MTWVIGQSPSPSRIDNHARFREGCLLAVRAASVDDHQAWFDGGHAACSPPVEGRTGHRTGGTGAGPGRARAATGRKCRDDGRFGLAEG